MHTQPHSRADDLGRLLDALAEGGRQHLTDLDDWRDHLASVNGLRHSPVRRWFECALRTEWPHVEPPSELCASVAEHVEGYLRGHEGPGWVVWGHICRVTGWAMWLADQHGADPEATYLIGILHDVCKLDEWEMGIGHEALGADYAYDLLRGEAPAELVDTVVQGIAIHPERPPLSWLAARTLHDADKLDKIGATGLLRRASVAESADEACFDAERTLNDADAFPSPSLIATKTLLRPKLAFTATLEGLLSDECE